MDDKKVITYQYSDGSGNTYFVTSKTIEYKPIKPEHSSSGTYDGGDDVKKEISESQYKSIVSVINKAINNKEIHIENRIMTSGLIIVEENGKKNRYIIKPYCEEQVQIEKILKEAIKK